MEAPLNSILNPHFPAPRDARGPGAEVAGPGARLTVDTRLNFVVDVK